MGPTCRCTYFLLANGCVTRFTRLGSSPSQKSLGVGAGSGSSSLALALCEAEAVAAGCALAVEIGLLREPRKRKRRGQEQRYEYPILFHFSTFFRVPHGGLHSSLKGVFSDLWI